MGRDGFIFIAILFELNCCQKKKVFLFLSEIRKQKQQQQNEGLVNVSSCITSRRKRGLIGF